MIPSQQGTDLNIFATWPTTSAMCSTSIRARPPASSKAYWGPQIKVGPVQPALSVDMDAYTNVESLHFNFDQQQNKIPNRLHLQPGDRRQYSDSHSADHAAESAAGC